MILRRLLFLVPALFLLSVLIFPVLALANLRSGGPEPAEAESLEPGAAAAEPMPEPRLM